MGCRRGSWSQQAGAPRAPFWIRGVVDLGLFIAFETMLSATRGFLVQPLGAYEPPSRNHGPIRW